MLCRSRCSTPPLTPVPPWGWTASRGQVTSGPLNTEGSFMSFQMYRSALVPSYLSRANCEPQYSRILGSGKSGYPDVPGQHHPSKSLSGELGSSTCRGFHTPLYSGLSIFGGSHLPSSSSLQPSGTTASGSAIFACDSSSHSSGFLSVGSSIILKSTFLMKSPLSRISVNTWNLSSFLMWGSTTFTNLRFLAEIPSIMFFGVGKLSLCQVKYAFPSVCSMSSQITSYGMSYLS
mmetsp:Transcript_20235/g.54106  ORF Transcript_20235/g.54106 Transcript_20235/m.54106 type:complete len:233 (+) Transcript_20235:1512-2210(+)